MNKFLDLLPTFIITLMIGIMVMYAIQLILHMFGVNLLG
jgi:hypothetical protein